MNRIRHARTSATIAALGCLLLLTGSAQAQTIGDAIGSIAFKQDNTGAVNGFLIENLSDLLPTATPDNVQFANLTLTVGATTVSFDTAFGSPVVVLPGAAVDTTDPAFPTDNVLQYPATDAPATAILRGNLRNASGQSLNLNLIATLTPADLTVPANPGDVNNPVTIRVVSSVPAPDAFAIALVGQGLGMLALRRRRAARRN